MMKRRDFLRTTVLVAGGSSLFGCSDDVSKLPDADAGMNLPPPFGGRTIMDGAAFFPQSVASGDPRASSVILWTRAVDAKASGDLTLMLQLALDAEFTMPVTLADEASELKALSDHDGCVRLRVEALEPNTTYYYRFAYIVGDVANVSRTGRTKTAADEDADVTVKFAVASCQDYGGRYYHSYKHMAEQELDFFIHLGDYVYETTGDPDFQSASGKRKVGFSDVAGALKLGSDADPFYAASSLSNYRDLYKTFRSDPDLQRVHELFPMIAIWDDHEFSDDCHGQTATYANGASDEFNAERRANADQAWFEFMPIDYAAKDFVYDRDAAAFPADLTIYRDFTFGKHLHVVMTDLRRYRDDHLIPEDAFPGAIAATEEDLMDTFGEVPMFAAAYVDLDASEFAAYKTFFAAEAETLGFGAADFKGLTDVPFINTQLGLSKATPKPTAIDAAGKKRGISYNGLFKTGRYTNVGARYVLRTEPFEAYARVVWTKTKGEAQQIMGGKQETWFFDTIKDSKQTWKVWGNEFTLMTRRVDLREQAAAAAIGLQTLLSLSGEDWDGVPDRRAKILDTLGDVPNVVAVTGDIHAFFAGVARHPEDSSKAVVEFVAGAISSAPYYDLLVSTAMSISPFAGALAENAEALLAAANPHIAQLSLKQNGYGMFSADGSSLNASYFAAEPDVVKGAKLAGDAKDAFTETAFQVQAGKKILLREVGGGTERWDPDMGKWVANN